MYYELKKGEEVVEAIRKSLFTVIPDLFKAFSLSLPAIFALLYFDIPYLTLASFGWLVFLFAYVLYVWLVWYYDVYMLTTDRIIDIHHKSLFAKEVTEITLDKVEDVNYSTDGMSSSLFGYGTVKISSKGSVNIELVSVSGPEDLRNIILELKVDK